MLSNPDGTCLNGRDTDDLAGDMQGMQRAQERQDQELAQIQLPPSMPLLSEPPIELINPDEIGIDVPPRGAPFPKPSVPYPKDPKMPPGPGWQWKGPPDKGSWFNPKTGEGLRPDVDHPPPVGPHYDYSPGRGGGARGGYRYFPDGTVVPKTGYIA